jgi:NADH:ubiquinone oxidoreductase subunit
LKQSLGLFFFIKKNCKLYILKAPKRERYSKRDWEKSNLHYIAGKAKNQRQSNEKLGGTYPKPNRRSSCPGTP